MAHETLTMFSFDSLEEIRVDWTEHCGKVDGFEILNVVGEGTYGIVYRAVDRKTNEVVALKKIRMTPKDSPLLHEHHDPCSDGFPQSSLLEMSILLNLKHENIVDMKEVVVGGLRAKDVYLVLEFCEQDLASLLDNMPKAFEQSQSKCILLQLLNGLEFLHSHFIVHRDVKMSNLLMSNGGQVKLGDFGLTRPFSIPYEAMTPHVVTLWYRAPELLLGSTIYGTGIDIWACGCIMGELIRNEPLFPGKTEAQQLNLIVDLLGTPNNEIWENFDQVPLAKTLKWKQQPYNNIRQTFPKLSSAALSLLNSFFVYDPKKRISASDALKSSFFKESPLPTPKDMMPSFAEYRNMSCTKNVI